jgi:hypothetical protein
MDGLNRLRENSRMKVPKGRLKVAQDVVLGEVGRDRQVPKGRLKITQDIVLGLLG